MHARIGTLGTRGTLGTLGSIVVSLALLGGCTSTTPRWDRDFGNSVRATMASQIIDPGAARNPTPVSGLDGRAALGAQDRYEHSAPAPTALTGTMGAGIQK